MIRVLWFAPPAMPMRRGKPCFLFLLAFRVIWVARRAFPLNLGCAHKRSIVKGVVRSLILGSVATLALAAAPAWAELKIGYVNYNALLAESPDAKVIQDALRNEFLPRQRELVNLQQSLKTREDKLTKDGATMTDDQRAREDKEIRDGDRELQRKQSEMQDDFNSRRNEELSKLQKSLIEQVRTYAKGQNYDLIIADSVIYATNSVDITPQVLAMLQANAPKTGAGAAPAAPKPAAK
jgi:outer membrane protein